MVPWMPSSDSFPKRNGSNAKLSAGKNGALRTRVWPAHLQGKLPLLLISAVCIAQPNLQAKH